MILRIAPQLVGDYAATAPVRFDYGFDPAYRGWTTRDRTVPGHIGTPSAASAEKGEHLFRTFAEGVTRFLQQVTAWDGHSWHLA